MSHFSKIKTIIKDLDTLKLSLIDLNLDFDTSQRQIVGYDSDVCKADIVINQTNNYNFGFVWSGNEYELVVDPQFWRQPWSIELFLEKLTQSYAYHSVNKESTASGFEKIDQTLQNNGAIKLTFQRWID
nr:Ycf35 [Erythrotrichia longistipitata]